MNIHEYQAKDLLAKLDAPDDPAQQAANEERDRRNAEMLEVYYVRTGQQPATARTVAEMEFAVQLEPCARCKTHELGTMVLSGGAK